MPPIPILLTAAGCRREQNRNRSRCVVEPIDLDAELLQHRRIEIIERHLLAVPLHGIHMRPVSEAAGRAIEIPAAFRKVRRPGSFGSNADVVFISDPCCVVCRP